MARKQRTDEETTNPYSSVTPGVTDIIDSSMELVNQSPVMASAVERDGLVAQMAPMRKYRVERQALIMNNGCRTMMKVGKIVDSSNYNLEALRSQGVQLTEIT
jgi:adenylate kinase